MLVQISEIYQRAPGSLIIRPDPERIALAKADDKARRKRCEMGGRNKRAVYGIDAKGKRHRFDSMSDAARAIKVTVPAPSQALIHYGRRTGGIVWKYEDEQRKAG